MRKPLFLIAINACLLIAIFAWLVQSLFVVQRMAQAQSVQGQVTWQQGGKGHFVPLSMGAAVATGDVIRTGAQSAAEFKWRGGTRWKLGPNSQLTLKSAVVNSKQNVELTQLQLVQGQIWVRAVSPMAPDSHFEIQTPIATAQVHSTVLGLKVMGNATQVSVLRGQAEVRGGNGEASLSEGKMAYVTATDLRVAPATDGGEFAAQPTLITPALDVKVRELSKTAALIVGETEAGDVVTIGQKPVPVARTGLFQLQVPLKSGHNMWQIDSTDTHGQHSTASRSLDIAVASSCEKPAT